jgi:hypothetical protein
MSKREKLPKLKENGILINLKNEINGITEELLQDTESDTRQINNSKYAAATIITETVNGPSKRGKNKKKANLLKNVNAKTNKQLEKRDINTC